MAGALQNDPRPEPIRRAELENLDPAEALLELKVLDPAMGSGHFLVTAVDFLSERIADLINSVPITPEWLDGDYTSPLVKRVGDDSHRNHTPGRRIKLGVGSGAT